MSENTLQGLMKTTMDNLKDMIDVNTIIGDPVETVDGTIIIPVSKVTFGFGSGGTESPVCYQQKDGASGYPFGGGSGAGINVSPVSFLVVTKDQVRMIPVTQTNSIDRLIDNIPEMINKVIDSIQSKLKQSDDNSEVINPS
ncbi:MAG: GerW family sporulation protein [Clostridium sp.]|uniref:GerW family sporulation protein n=1 Tax=Clostridium sp. TaxID=1506 RepID=UPI002FC67ABD